MLRVLPMGLGDRFCCYAFDFLTYLRVSGIFGLSSPHNLELADPVRLGTKSYLKAGPE
jgi:hypothetical protein